MKGLTHQSTYLYWQYGLLYFIQVKDSDLTLSTTLVKEIRNSLKILLGCHIVLSKSARWFHNKL